MRTGVLRSSAFSLVEVTLALGIAAGCLIAVFALLPTGLQSTRASVEQTAANSILTAVAADLRATPATSPPGGATTSQQYSIPIPANPVAAGGPVTTLYFDGAGKASTTLTNTSRSRLTIEFQANGSNAKAATFASLKVSWPAPAALTTAAGTVQNFVALDRN